MFTPSKVLPFLVDSTDALDFWPFDDGTNDPYWEGGATPQPYRWQYTLTVSEVYHSSHLTAHDRKYTAEDVFVGMWMADLLGNALKIVGIVSKSPTQLVVIAEDVDRFNTFQDPSQTGNGSIKTTEGVIFELDDEGMPQLDPLPGNVNVSFLPNLTGRFQRFDPQMRFRFQQANHGFQKGDVLVLNPSSGYWEKSSADNSSLFPIGTVADDYPYPNTFYLRPFNEIVENITPALPGRVGDFLYSDLSNPGKLTVTPGGKKVFIKLTAAVPTTLKGLYSGVMVNAGDVLSLNGVSIPLTGGDIASVVADINLASGHHVIASSVSAPTTLTSLPGDLAYGIVGAILPVSAEINGVMVNFTTDASGSVAFGMAGASDCRDMAVDINAAAIPYISASVDGENLILTHLTGGTISIVNVTNDGSGYGFAGPSSCTGLPLSAAGSTASFISLVRNDGGIIEIKDQVGNPSTVLGIYTVANGRLPVGMIVESAGSGEGGGGPTTTTYVEYVTPTNGQTVFTLPRSATTLLAFSINGMETKYAVLTNPSTITFDPVLTGYGIEETDEVMITYNG